MTIAATFAEAMARCPLVAILRGVRPEEIVAIADALVAARFTMIEVPLNSPRPLESIELIAGRYGPDVLVGAGTVTGTADVAQVAAHGGRLMVAPNTDQAVIAAAVAAGMVALPGYFTPTEALAALAAGAHGLKLFPAEAATPAVLKAQRAILPPDVPVLAVGGVGIDDLATWRAAGAAGAGLGSALYSPGLSAVEVTMRAQAFVAAWAATG